MNLKQALIENDSIRLRLEAADWKEAVKLAVEPLIESGAILPEYYDAIIESTEEYGPYYILMPGMAMPHARPGRCSARCLLTDYLAKTSCFFRWKRSIRLTSFGCDKLKDSYKCSDSTNYRLV